MIPWRQLQDYLHISGRAVFFLALIRTLLIHCVSLNFQEWEATLCVAKCHWVNQAPPLMPWTHWHFIISMCHLLMDLPGINISHMHSIFHRLNAVSYHIHVTTTSRTEFCPTVMFSAILPLQNPATVGTPCTKLLRAQQADEFSQSITLPPLELYALYWQSGTSEIRSYPFRARQSYQCTFSPSFWVS